MENLIAKTQKSLIDNSHMAFLAKHGRIQVRACKKTGRLILGGQVGTFFQKQIAGHLAAKARNDLGITEVEIFNAIEVG